jgi:hypothetical protein
MTLTARTGSCTASGLEQPNKLSDKEPVKAEKMLRRTAQDPIPKGDIKENMRNNLKLMTDWLLI